MKHLNFKTSFILLTFAFAFTSCDDNGDDNGDSGNGYLIAKIDDSEFAASRPLKKRSNAPL